MQNLPGDHETEANCDDFADASAILTIDLQALAHNYRFLKEKSGKAECAAVVKADAYGLGLEECTRALLDEGCKTFFVANLDEARRLRGVTLDADVYVMGGLYPGTAKQFTQINAIPVLNTVGDVSEWATHSQDHCSGDAPAAIQVDSGMNRLGMKKDAVAELLDEGVFGRFQLKLVMSHLACADEPEHPLNRQQLDAFSSIRNLFPDTPASLCNSAGIFLGGDFHFDITRPGIALYGGRARNNVANPMKQVVTLEGRIAQVQIVPEGEIVGYGAAQTMTRDTSVATISLGYADGFFRYLGSTDDLQKTNVFVAGSPAPLIGRVSMDLITADVTDIKDVQRGQLVEVLGEHVTVDDLADQAGTIGYEILTSLGNRYRRIYK